MSDIRLVAASIALILSVLGYITLVATGDASSAEELLKTIGLPTLTFIIGLGSTIVGGKDD